MNKMDPQLFEMIQQRFDSVDSKLDSTNQALQEHFTKDEKYWRKVDKAETEVGLVKRLFWSFITILGAVGAWFGISFKH